MKLYILIIILLISTSLSSQVVLTTDQTDPLELFPLETTFLVCDYDLSSCQPSTTPSCSRNYSGKDLFFIFEMPESGYIKATSLFRNITDFGMAFYDANDNEISCTQVISDEAFVVVDDSIYSGQIIKGRIWINSGTNQGRLALSFDLQKESAAKVPVIDINAASPEELVSDVLISGCIQAFNIQYTGNPESIGYFSNGSPGLDFSSGIVLSTGKAVKVAGPNNSPAVCSNMHQPGDAILTSLINRQTYDAAVLEFDFIPSSDVLSFQYAFGSEEYEEYVGGVFNDIFTFHISGGPEDYNNINIAKIPGTNTPVSINNVNQNINTEWYYNNDNGAHLQYDGMTVTLTASAAVTPCQTYHIRLAIADAADPIFDSGVFLKAGSFSSGTIPLVKNDNGWLMVNNTYEDCDNELVFARSDAGNLDIAFDFNIQILGSATPETDFSTIPIDLQIPAGEESLRVPYTVFSDEIPEGSEQIVVRVLTECNCNGAYYDQIITINDPLEVSGIISNNGPVCAGDSVNINIDFDILPEYNRIEWSTGQTDMESVRTVLSESGYVTAEVFYPCGSETFSTWVDVKPLPDANIYTNAPICDGQDLEFSAENGISYLWKGPGGWSSIESSTGITGAIPSQSGFYGVTVTGENGCQYREMLDIHINEWPEPQLPESLTLCERDNLNLSSGNFYAYQWEGPSGWSSSQQNLIINNILIENAGSYFVIVSDDAGCTGEANVNIFVNPSPVAQVNFNYPICRGESLLLHGFATGETWWQGPNNFYSTLADTQIDNVDQTNSGIYGFYALNEFNCSDSVLSEVIVTVPDAQISGNTFFCASTNYVELQSLYLGGLWSGNGIVNMLNGGFSPSTAGEGEHEVVYYIGYPGCEDFDTAFISVESAPELALNVPDGVCNNNGIVVLEAQPLGGVWSGSGITDGSSGMFDPSVISSNTVNLIYTWTEGACTVSDTASVDIYIGINAHIFNVQPICETSEPILLHSNQGSGIWTGQGIINVHTGKFDPQVAGPGVHRIYFTASNLHCTDVDSIDIVVDEFINAELSAETNYCINESEVEISLNITGEHWSGFGITNESGVFSPSEAGIGSGLVNLEIENGACSSSAQYTFNVFENADASFSLPVQFCLYDEAFEILPNQPNGIWNSTGIADSLNGVFNPQLAGVGTHIITYNISNPACNSMVSTETEVIFAPDPHFSAIAVYCSDDTPEQLQAVTIGGEWSGTGIIDNVNGIFDPQTAGVGAHLITYSIAGTDCISQFSRYMFVFDGNQTISSDIASQFCMSDEEFFLSATPTGGVWTGAGISFDSIFNPMQASEGTHQLIYTTGVNTCLVTETFEINVSELPEIQMISTAQICPNSTPFELSADTPDGYWSGEAVIDGWFNPNIATENISIVYYNYSVDNCNHVYDFEIAISEAPQITFSGLDNSYCKNYGDVSFEVLPTGGLFEGNWVDENSNFNTNNLNEGTNYLTYILEYGNSCSATQQFEVEILGVPEVLIEGLENSYCINSNDISFHTVPWGGTFEGIEISGNTFSPSTTGIGEHFLSYSYTAPNGCSDSFIQSVNIYGLPEISFEIFSEPTCYNASNGIVEIHAEDAVDLFFDELAVDETGFVSDVSGGWHYVFVSNTNGCQKTDSVFIGQPDSLVVIISGTSVIPCNQTEGILTAAVSGGTYPYNYIWSDTNLTELPNISGLAAGEYFLTITDANNCKKIVGAQISNYAVADYEISYSDSLQCHNSTDGFININCGGSDLEIVWENDLNGFNLENLSPASYVFTLVDSEGCSVRDSVIINSPEPIIINSEINSVECGVSNGSISIIAEGGKSPYLYLWQDSTSGNLLSGVSAGNYSVTITDLNSCTETSAFTVDAIGEINTEIEIIQSIKCYGDQSAILNASSVNGLAPLNFVWSDGSIGNLNQNNGAGTYFVSLTDAQGCAATDSIFVEQPEPILVSDSVTNIVCKGDNSGSVRIYCSGGTGYLNCHLDNGHNGFNFNNLSAGLYNYTVTDSNNCRVFGNTEVVEPTDNLNLDFIRQEPLCFNDNSGHIACEVTGGEAPYSYNWEWQGYSYSENEINNLFAGNYNLTVSDINNCFVYVEIILSQPEPVETFYVSNAVSCNGNSDGNFSATATGGVFPYIFTCGDSISNNGKFENLYPGNYYYIVSDANGCESQGVMAIVSESSEECLFVPNAFTPNGDGYNDRWEIENIEMFPYARIQVFNRWGQVVFETVSDNQIWDGKTQIGELPSGTYIYSIEPNNGSRSLNGTVNIVR